MDNVFSKRDLFSVLENIDDDSPVCVRTSDGLVFDISFGFEIVDGEEILVIGLD